MKQRRNLSCLHLLLLLLLTACGTQVNHDITVVLDPPPGIPAEQAEAAVPLMRDLPNGTQFAIALIEDSTARFYGVWRDNDSLKTVDNSGRVFEIGSISKVFTSNLLARLVVEGQADLDRPVREVLDVPLNEDAYMRLEEDTEITLRHLANHTSGLPRLPSNMGWLTIFNQDNPYKNYDEEKLRNYLSEEMLIHNEPGTHFQYSNLGAGLLGYALERITGKSYETMLQEQIFGPLRMEHSTTERPAVENRLVGGLNASGKPTPNWDVAALKAAGAILSSTENMARFARASFDTTDPINILQQRESFEISESRSIALGWLIIRRESGERWLWHNGGTGGYRSSLTLDPRKKRGVILLSNISADHERAAAIDSLAFVLMETLDSEF